MWVSETGVFVTTNRHKYASIQQATKGNTEVYCCSVVLGVHSCPSCELGGNLKLLLTSVSYFIPPPPSKELWNAVRAEVAFSC